ncbi:MAG: C-terminal binding protein [Chitinivibrionales bacterium]|nr:C-terminal binding protein [Chitinivibrionales bacterium]
MQKYKVLVTDHVFDDFDIEREVLSRAGAGLFVNQFRSVDELLPHVGDIHGLLNCYLGPLDRRLFDAAPSLKVISRYGIGLDTINVEDATQYGIVVSNVPDHAVNEVADHTVGMFLSLARKINLSWTRVKRGEWSLSYVKPLPALRTMTAGFIGFGKIGRATAARLKPFGLRMIFHTPSWKGTVNGCSQVTLDELLATSDAVFIHCPSTPETYHMIDWNMIEKMERRPLLINTARGSIIDTGSLVRGLAENRIRGAALDVLEDINAVVRKNHALKKFESVIVTPHSAFYSDESVKDLRYRVAENAARVLCGEKPLFCANEQLLQDFE